MTQGTGPLVSILVPTYNAEATLAESLQSALASSYENLEIVLVDDGSTDATVAVADTLAREDQRICVFRQPHRGVSATLNFGLSQVRGEFVARLDADDLWHRTKLEKQVELLTTDPALALVYTFVRYVDESGHVVRDAAPQKMQGAALCQCLYEGIVGGGSSVVFRRSVLDINAYVEQLSIWEDLLLHLKVAAAGSVTFIPEYLTAYRLRRDSSSADLELSLKNWRLAARRIATDFPQIPAFVHRWSHSRRLLDLAEGFALDRRYGIAAALLAECFASDPTRTSAFLAYRLHRRFSGNRSLLQRSGPLFANADVTTNYSLSPFDTRLEGHRLRALDESRYRLLQSIDRDLIRPLRSTAAEGMTPRVEAAS